MIIIFGKKSVIFYVALESNFLHFRGSEEHQGHIRSVLHIFLPSRLHCVPHPNLSNEEPRALSISAGLSPGISELSDSDECHEYKTLQDRDVGGQDHSHVDAHLGPL